MIILKNLNKNPFRYLKNACYNKSIKIGKGFCSCPAFMYNRNAGNAGRKKRGEKNEKYFSM